MHTYMLAAPDNRRKSVVFKICTPSTDFIIETDNMQADNAKDTDVVISKTFRSLLQ